MSVSVNTDHSGLVTNEQTKLVRVADGHILGGKPFKKQRSHNM